MDTKLAADIKKLFTEPFKKMQMSWQDLWLLNIAPESRLYS